jgi:hypothetical protein
MSRHRTPVALASASTWVTVAMRRSAASLLTGALDPARVARDQLVIHGRLHDEVEAALTEYEQAMFPRSTEVATFEGAEVHGIDSGDNTAHALINMITEKAGVRSARPARGSSSR